MSLSVPLASSRSRGAVGPPTWRWQPRCCRGCSPLRPLSVAAQAGFVHNPLTGPRGPPQHPRVQQHPLTQPACTQIPSSLMGLRVGRGGSARRHTCTQMHTRMPAYMQERIYAHMHVCTPTCMYTCMYTCTHKKCMRTSMHINTHMQSCMQTCIHTLAHACTHVCLCETHMCMLSMHAHHQA